MGYLESNLLDELSSQFLYLRYMDDFLVISQTEKIKKALFCNLNMLHEKISFTTDVEINDQIPFLDILVKWSKDKFLTSGYRKPSFTRKYLHFQSFCTKKKNLDKNSIPSGLYDLFP